MYTLYFAPGACSLAVQIKLLAAGCPYQRVSLSLKQREHLTPEFQRINAQQRVPVLALNGEYFSEAMALLLFLEQQHPQGLLPKAPNLLALTLQRMNWLSNTLHIDFATLWRPVRYSDDENVQQALSDAAKPRLLAHFSLLEQQLASHHYWICDELTLADYYLIPFLRWGNIVFSEVSSMTAIQRYLARMAELAEVKAALACEGITLQPS